jgi:acylglycerol lipase
MRGHGRSAGARASSPSIDAYLDDLDRVPPRGARRRAGPAGVPDGPQPRRADRALYAIERRARRRRRRCCRRPALAFDAPALQAGAIRLIAGLSPDAPHARDAPRRLLVGPGGDRRSMDRRSADLRAPRARRAPPARRSTASPGCGPGPEALRAPLLALHGTIDKLTAPSGSRDLVARAGADRSSTLRLYPGLNHDLLHEPDGAGRARSPARCEAWLLARTPAARR